jgi:hypothetical protein
VLLYRPPTARKRMTGLEFMSCMRDDWDCQQCSGLALRAWDSDLQT